MDAVQSPYDPITSPKSHHCLGIQAHELLGDISDPNNNSYDIENKISKKRKFSFSCQGLRIIWVGAVISFASLSSPAIPGKWCRVRPVTSLESI